MDYITPLGLIAGTLTTISLIPQLVKTLKTKSAHDISLGMFIILATGIFLWLWYGILIDSIPIILANSASFTLILIIIRLKIKYT